MILRKINAGLSLITTALLLDHAIFLSVWMLNRGGIEKSAEFMPWILLWLMVAHAFLSLALAVIGRKGAKKGGKNYTKLNAQTIIQRITAILMLLFLALHLVGAANHFQPPILHAILHPIFFAIVLVHVAVSLSKSMVTLGIGNAKAVKAVDITIKILCAVIFIACIIGFYMCLFMGVAK